MTSFGYKKLSNNAFPPSRSSPQAAGLDLRSPYTVTIRKFGKALIYTDLAVKLPQNCYGRIASRSGLALNSFVHVVGGVIDGDYTGNVGVIMYNHSGSDYIVKRGDRIAQLICEVLVIPEICEISDIEETARGSMGFGSTGK